MSNSISWYNKHWDKENESHCLYRWFSYHCLLDLLEFVFGFSSRGLIVYYMLVESQTINFSILGCCFRCSWLYIAFASVSEHLITWVVLITLKLFYLLIWWWAGEGNVILHFHRRYESSVSVSYIISLVTKAEWFLCLHKSTRLLCSCFLIRPSETMWASNVAPHTVPVNNHSSREDSQTLSWDLEVGVVWIPPNRSSCFRVH